MKIKPGQTTHSKSGKIIITQLIKADLLKKPPGNQITEINVLFPTEGHSKKTQR